MILTLNMLTSKPKSHVRFADSNKRLMEQQQKQKRYADDKRRATLSPLCVGDWVRVRVQVLIFKIV